MKIVWKPAALAQLEQIHAYIAREDPAAAARVVKRIRELTRLLEDFPFAGQETSRAGVRGLPAWPYPYRLFYRVVLTKGEVRVLRVRHAKRRPIA
jgi:toxin ParE1/3/4